MMLKCLVQKIASSIATAESKNVSGFLLLPQWTLTCYNSIVPYSIIVFASPIFWNFNSFGMSVNFRTCKNIYHPSVGINACMFEIKNLTDFKTDNRSWQMSTKYHKNISLYGFKICSSAVLLEWIPVSWWFCTEINV